VSQKKSSTSRRRWTARSRRPASRKRSTAKSSRNGAHLSFSLISCVVLAIILHTFIDILRMHFPSNSYTRA
jgi:F0F1-type ATP synthase assembly protein I